MTARLLVIQHIAMESPGIILPVIESAGIEYSMVMTFDGHIVPTRVGDHSGLLVMGGPMGVYDFDKNPHLVDELNLIRAFLDRGKPILGICLGSQLMAAALGGRIAKGKKEIGWHKIHFHDNAMKDPMWRSIDRDIIAFHWHGDIFDLPPNTVPLASSRMTDIQGFRYDDNAYGLLFHMEMTAKIIEDLTATFPDDLIEAGTDEKRIYAGIKKYLPSLNKAGGRFFENWISSIKG